MERVANGLQAMAEIVRALAALMKGVEKLKGALWQPRRESASASAARSARTAAPLVATDAPVGM